MASQDVDVIILHDREEKIISKELHNANISDERQEDQPEELKVEENLGSNKEYHENENIQQVAGKNNSQAYEALRDEDLQANQPISQSQPQHDFVTLGSFHQGDQTFKESAGQQCTVIALVAAIKAQQKLPNQWDADDVDEVVIKGDERYNLSALSGCPAVDEVPTFFFLGDVAITWDVKELFDGTLCLKDEGPFFNLSSALHRAFSHEVSKASALLVCYGHTTAIVKIHSLDTYALVDSHARNRGGVNDPNGTAVVLFFKSLTKLYEGVFYDSMVHLEQKRNTQYSLHKLRISRSEVHQPLQTQGQNKDGKELKVDVTKARKDAGDWSDKEGTRSRKDIKDLEDFLQELDGIITLEESSRPKCNRTFITPHNDILGGSSSEPYIKDVHYRYDTESNEGSCGIVIKAVDYATKRVFALKMLKNASEFRREEVLISWILVGYGCPEFLGVHYEVDDHGCCTICLMFSCMKGPTLTERMRLRRNYIPVTEEFCIRWLRQILCTLKHMWEHGIVHNDIYDDNFMFRTPRCQEIVLIDFGSADIFNVSLGMESGSIKDDQICASSEKSHILHRYSKSRSRLNQPSGRQWESAGAWKPNTNEQTEWIGVQFAEDTPVKGVILQGCHMEEAWVTKYYVSYKKKYSNFQFVKSAYGQFQVFVGNEDSNTPQAQMFPQTIEACEIRIYPHQWYNSIALRFELLGTGQDVLWKHHSDVKNAITWLTSMQLPKFKPIQEKLQTAAVVLRHPVFRKYSKMGMEDWTIGDECLTRLNIKPQCGPYRPLNGWCPNLVDDWDLCMTVNFKKPRTITGIITQGHGYKKMWVEEYCVFYKTPERMWQPVQHSDGKMVFRGNRDNHTPVEQFFPTEVQAIAVRIQLLQDKWHQYPALRFELLGEPELDVGLDVLQQLTVTDETTLRLREKQTPATEETYGNGMTKFLQDFFSPRVGRKT
ncbi:uncharacterized protein [Amphiura filiformis]|uniref:uncharacterized protein n=1 Tax=Amphiura filiformis TaxID=82378 RepID=UPI003B2135C3